MPRKRPDNRIPDLIAAATKVFGQLGYKRTQMGDVAREMGVSSGTLYLYVEGKAALFDLVIRDALSLIDRDALPELPIAAPDPADTLALVKPRLLTDDLIPELSAALGNEHAEDVVDEFGGIIRGLFRVMSENRNGLVVLEKSAYDWPELADVLFESMRKRLLRDLIAYLEIRIAAGQVRRLPEPRLAALEILQTLTWFCMYRQNEMDWPELTDNMVSDSLVDSLTHAFIEPKWWADVEEL